MSLRSTTTTWLTALAATMFWLVVPSPATIAADFTRGDVDASGDLTVHDAVLITAHLSGELELPCPDAADADDDGEITRADARRILVAAYDGASSPPAPFPSPGADPTADTLGCETFEPIPPADPADLSVDYSFSTQAHRGSVFVETYVTSPRPVRAIEVQLGLDPSRVNHVRPVVPDSLKGEGRFFSDIDEDGRIVVFYGFDRAIPAGESRLAARLELCVRNPTPHPIWELPVEIESFDLSSTATPGRLPLEPESLVASVYWGNTRSSRQAGCFRAPPAPDFFQCTTQEDGSVLLTWENPVAYDSIDIHAGMVVTEDTAYRRIIDLPGDATSWLDEDGGADHNYVYEIKAYVRDEAPGLQGSAALSCAATDPRDAVAFLRGDVNQDGLVSTADAVAFQRSAFGDAGPLACSDAADVNDDGSLGIEDIFAIPFYLYGIGGESDPRFGTQPQPPFPEPGFDPTHAGESFSASCESYDVTPPRTTTDAVRIGQVEASPGEVVSVPIYLTNEVAVASVQLVVRYDPQHLEVLSGADQVTFEDTFYSPLIEQHFFPTPDGHFTWDGPHIAHVQAFPEAGYFTLGIVGSMIHSDMFAVIPGADTRIGNLLVRVSGDVRPGTVLSLTPEDGPDGEGFGLFGLRNELSYQGEGRLATILPTKLGGELSIGVDGDVSFFLRADANATQQVDIADAVFTLRHLFLMGEPPPCPDAADADDSGELDLSDAILTLSVLFLGEGTIPPPYPEAGQDPAPDFLPPCR